MKYISVACATAATLAALAMPAAAVPFSQADQNHDGVVTYPEAKRVFTGLSEVHYQKCDPDGDGAIDEREYPLLNNFYTIMYLDR